MRRNALAFSILPALAACSVAGGPPPLLAPRAAEAIDPRVPVVPVAAPERPVDAKVAGRLADLLGQAIDGNTAFESAAGRAETLAASAGAAQTESWIAAQQALSQAVAARAPTARALGDADAMAAGIIAASGGIAAPEFSAIQSVAARISDIDRRQAERLDAIQKRLGG